MGSEDADNPTKTPESSSSQEQNETPKSSSAQEQPPPSSPATVFPDLAAYQAYYNFVGTPPIPPPGFFHSSVASSPQAHSYMWGQHMMPPFGTPPQPYVTMYPHGGYAHPSIPPGSHPFGPYTILSPNGTTKPSAPAAGGKELEGKSGRGKSKLRLKRSKGSLGSLTMLTGMGSDTVKTSGASDNGGGFSQSGESGGEGSSGGSDDTISQNGSQHSGKVSAVAETQNGFTLPSVSSGPNQVLTSQSMVMPMPPTSVSSPTTNLNIGMDYWGGSAPPQVATLRAKLPTVQPPGTIVPTSGVSSELWIQDERELKRQRRKQSNRESARRSRLRKQAEYDELAQHVETLKEENSSLREELERIREECKKLASENTSLTDKLQKHEGQDSRVDRIHGQPESDPEVDANL